MNTKVMQHRAKAVALLVENNVKTKSVGLAHPYFLRSKSEIMNSFFCLSLSALIRIYFQQRTKGTKTYFQVFSSKSQEKKLGRMTRMNLIQHLIIRPSHRIDSDDIINKK